MQNRKDSEYNQAFSKMQIPKVLELALVAIYQHVRSKRNLKKNSWIQDPKYVYVSTSILMNFQSPCGNWSDIFI